MNYLKPNNSNVVVFDTPNRDNINQSVYGESDVLLGRGSYGTVIRAIYKKRNVAVKIIEKANDFKYKSLKRESRIMNLENHDNIIKVMKIVNCKDYGALIMERFKGKTLQTVLNTVRVDLFHRLHILSDIASALSYCHSMEIIHCDVKPQNVFVAVGVESKYNRPYVCKLFDFGCSVGVKESDPYEQICGTYLYSAPEILQNLKPSSSADIFSLAIVMWQLKENKIPYGSIHDIEAIIWKVVKNDLRPDTCLSVEEPRSSISISPASPYHQNNKSVDKPLRQKLRTCSDKKIPKILVEKSYEKPLSHQKLGIKKIKRTTLTGKKLFQTNVDEDDEEDDQEMKNLFIDHHERLAENISLVENKYVSLYQRCWSRDQFHRFSASAVHDSLQFFINLL